MGRKRLLFAFTALALTALALTALALIGAGPAPISLTGASPSADSVAEGAPDVVELTFSDSVQASRSTIVVKRDGGRRVDGGDMHIVGDDHHLAVGLKTLLPGHYLVTWTILAADARKLSGSYGFTVGQ